MKTYRIETLKVGYLRERITKLVARLKPGDVVFSGDIAEDSGASTSAVCHELRALGIAKILRHPETGRASLAIVVEKKGKE